MSRRLPGPMGVPVTHHRCADTRRRAMQPMLLRPLDTCEQELSRMAVSARGSVCMHSMPSLQDMRLCVTQHVAASLREWQMHSPAIFKH